MLRAALSLLFAALLTPTVGEAPKGFHNDAYVELKSDPATGGFLQEGTDGGWDVWPRMGGKSFKGFLGYGYYRMTASGGRVAEGIDPEDWEVVRFPTAPTGPAPGGVGFTTTGARTHQGDFKGLVGKTFRFTISGLGGLDCGCNANFYAVRLGAGCDGSGNNGALCEEFDFFEGNKYAWHSTLHVLNDKGDKSDIGGIATGYGGVLPSWPGFPSFDGDEFGPQGTMIDTTQDFSVAASFPRGSDGRMKGMCVELSQVGKPSMKQPLFMHLYAYNGSDDVPVGDGIAKVESRVTQGITMLSSMWSAGNGEMRWLDGSAHPDGPAWMKNFSFDGKCNREGSCAPYSIKNVMVQDLPSMPAAPVAGAAGAASAATAACSFTDAPSCGCTWIQEADACADSSGACYAPCKEANPEPGCFCPPADAPAPSLPAPAPSPPTAAPMAAPTAAPIAAPTLAPVAAPTQAPMAAPTVAPAAPTAATVVLPAHSAQQAPAAPVLRPLKAAPAYVGLPPLKAAPGLPPGGPCVQDFQQCGGKGLPDKACCHNSFTCRSPGNEEYKQCTLDLLYTAVEDHGKVLATGTVPHTWWRWGALCGAPLLGAAALAAFRGAARRQHRLVPRAERSALLLESGAVE